MDTIKQYLVSNNIKFEVDIKLKDKTWIGRGGNCKLWIKPQSVKELHDISLFLINNRFPFDVVGATSNIYFKNEYDTNIIISTLAVDTYDDKEEFIVCDCGVKVKSLAKYAVDYGYVGFEGLVSLPGTVAAAIYNNASCYNCSISSLLYKIEYLDEQGHIKEAFPDDLKYSHRSSAFKIEELKGVILRIYIRKISGNRESLLSIAEKTRETRKDNQEGPRFNLGSTYAALSYRKTVLLIMTCINLYAKIFRIPKLVRNRLIKNCLVDLYGDRRLKNFISDYYLGCYVWRNELADTIFPKYVDFINRITIYSKLEIEIKD